MASAYGAMEVSISAGWLLVRNGGDLGMVTTERIPEANTIAE